MPAAYEAMRDHFAKENRARGMSAAAALKAAKTKAARIYNAKHKRNPVHPGMHKQKKRK
jgi:hypothetical protein